MSTHLISSMVAFRVEIFLCKVCSSDVTVIFRLVISFSKTEFMPVNSDNLITSSSYVFHESWIYEFFSQNFMFHFLSFFVMINSYIGLLDLLEKQSKIKFCKFRNCENIWWAWPESQIADFGRFGDFGVFFRIQLSFELVMLGW